MRRAVAVDNEAQFVVNHLAASPFHEADGQRVHDGDEKLVGRDRSFVAGPNAFVVFEQVPNKRAFRGLGGVERELTGSHFIFPFSVSLLFQKPRPHPERTGLQGRLRDDVGC